MPRRATLSTKGLVLIWQQQGCDGILVAPNGRADKGCRMPADLVTPRPLTAIILDVVGVLVDSPHERAWRDAPRGITDPARLTTEVYQTYAAGKPRLSGAGAVLEQLGLPDVEPRVLFYAGRKQLRLEELIAAGDFTAFRDALRFVRTVGTLGSPSPSPRRMPTG
jgi:hypothetical protein